MTIIFTWYAVLTAFVFTGAINAEEIHNFRMCENSLCEIFELNIDPCPQALEDKPCELPQGANSSITFNFKSFFNSTTPQTRLYAKTLFVDLPFMDMDPNACLYTACPIVEDVEAKWKYELLITSQYPKGKYTVKFKYWNPENRASRNENECCFLFNIAIV